MNITYDAELSGMFWEMLSTKATNKVCPFCETRVNKKNFGGALNYKDDIRLMHGTLPCIIGLVNYKRLAPTNDKEET